MVNADPIAFAVVAGVCVFLFIVFNLTDFSRILTEQGLSWEHVGADQTVLGVNLLTVVALISVWIVYYNTANTNLPPFHLGAELWNPDKDIFLSVGFWMFLAAFLVNWVAKVVMYGQLELSVKSRPEAPIWVAKVFNSLIFTAFWLFATLWAWIKFADTREALQGTAVSNHMYAVYISSFLALAAFLLNGSGYVRNKSVGEAVDEYIGASIAAGNVLKDKDIKTPKEKHFIQGMGTKVAINNCSTMLDGGDHRTPLCAKLSEISKGGVACMVKTRGGVNIVMPSQDQRMLEQAIVGHEVSKMVGAMRTEEGLKGWFEYHIQRDNILGRFTGFASWFNIQPSVLAAYNLTMLYTYLVIWGFQLQAVVFFGLANFLPLVLSMISTTGFFLELHQLAFLATVSISYITTFWETKFQLLQDRSIWNPPSEPSMADYTTTAWLLAVGVIVSSAVSVAVVLAFAFAPEDADLSYMTLKQHIPDDSDGFVMKKDGRGGLVYKEDARPRLAQRVAGGVRSRR